MLVVTYGNIVPLMRAVRLGHAARFSVAAAQEKASLLYRGTGEGLSFFAIINRSFYLGRREYSHSLVL
jgi:hypothetical protein